MYTKFGSFQLTYSESRLFSSLHFWLTLRKTNKRFES